jgi:hypothetical protein
MTWTRLLGVMLVCGLVGAARAEPSGVVGGRLLLRTGNSEMSLAAARAAADGEALVLELRRGAHVLEASLDEDGYFWVQAPAGTYRLEYLRVGKRAEFFAPQELVIQPGAITCAGTVALDLERVEALGANVSNRVTVTDQCAETMPRLRGAEGTFVERVAIARPGEQYEHHDGVSWRTLVVGLRAEISIGEHLALRGLYRLPPLAREGLFSRWIFLVGGGGVRGDRDEIAYDVTVGAGVRVSYFDLLGIGGVRWRAVEGVETGPVAGGVIRMHSVVLGLGLRFEALPSRAAFLTVDLAPLGLLGSLL